MLRGFIIINNGNIQLGFHIGITSVIMMSNKGSCFHKSAFIMLKLTCFCYIFFVIYFGIYWMYSEKVLTFQESICDRKAESPVQGAFQGHESRTRMFLSHLW